jgi:hypothetical protein
MSLSIGEALPPPSNTSQLGSSAVAEWHAVIMAQIARLSGKTWSPNNPRTKYENDPTS